MTVPILLYHSISDRTVPGFQRWVVQPERFAEQMRYLADGGYRAITVSEYARHMLDGSEPAGNPVVITFDDGFADFRTTALPILREFALRSTLYLTTSYLDGANPGPEASRPMMGWSDATFCIGEDVEVGAHGHTHRQLDTLSLDAAVEDVACSRDLLERRLGAAVATLAYPHGYSSKALRCEVAAMGFIAACGVKHAVSSLQDDRFSLARIIVGSDVDTERFRMLLRGHRLRVAPRTATVPAWGWRWYRRIRGTGRRAHARVTP